MLYFLLFVSVMADVIKNSYWNHFGKNTINSLRDTCLFNGIVGSGGVLFFAIFGRQFVISQQSLLLAVAFALVTAGAQFFSLLALSCGPMSISVLFTYLGGMLIPTVFGVVFRHQRAGVFQVVGLILMIVTVFLGVEKGGNNKKSVKWFVYALFSLILWGLVGILQQVQQDSKYSNEQNGFLFWSFVIMTVLFFVISLVRKGKEKDNLKIKNPAIIIVMVTGTLNGAVNLINLYLSGHMASIIFFPIVNGGVIILAALAALIVFHERPNKRQAWGMIIGLVSVLLLGIG